MVSHADIAALPSAGICASAVRRVQSPEPIRTVWTGMPTRARVAPSVVNIEVLTNSPQPGIADQSSGSGFVIDAEGHIVTNAHVVNNAREILVTFHDGMVANAQLVGLDAYSDIALVRVNADAAALVPVVFGDSDAVRVGERAIAIGNPFGLESSMTVGIVSGLGRQLPSADLLGGAFGGYQNPSIVQIDADINPGNSGGPLLNSHGEVIGVTTAIRTETGLFEGVGFAVPARTVQRVIPDLLVQGEVDYAWIGITSQGSETGLSVTGLANTLDLPVRAGVLIDTVLPDSPAAHAGLRGGTREVLVRGQEICVGGDIIIAVDDRYIDNMDALTAYLVMHTRPGSVVRVRVVRGEQTFELPVRLEARPNVPSATPRCGMSE